MNILMNMHIPAISLYYYYYTGDGDNMPRKVVMCQQKAEKSKTAGYCNKDGCKQFRVCFFKLALWMCFNDDDSALHSTRQTRCVLVS